MANNLIIHDTEIAGASNLVSTYAERLMQMIDQINTALKTVTETAIKDQAISPELGRIAEKLDGMKQPIENLAEAVREDSRSFLQEIDEADQFLY